MTVPLREFGLAKRRAQALELAAEACESVGLNPGDTLGRYPHQLSGGQRQRLLVADEPVSMVDASLRATILANIVTLNSAHGIAIVYITHDITTAYHVADEVLVLHRGHVVERGDAASVIGNPQHAYTRLLVASIPWPDLDRRWGDGESAAERQTALATHRSPSPTARSPFRTCLGWAWSSTRRPARATPISVIRSASSTPTAARTGRRARCRS